MKLIELFEATVNTSWHGSKKDPEWYQLYKDKPLKVKTVNHSGIGGQPKGTYAIRSFTKVGKSKAEFTINFDGGPVTGSVDLDNPETVLNKKYDRVLKFYFYAGAMPITPRQAFNLFQVKNGKSITESKEIMFKVQQRDDSKSEWEDLADELYTKEEAQELLDTSDSDDFRVEERAISTDGKVTLRPTPKNKKTKDVLARNASPAVHKRNKDFFDKHL